MDQLLQYATNRIIELENLLLVNVEETVWPAEVGMVYSQIESAGDLPAHHQRRLKHHINRMWLEKMPVPSIIAAARSLAIAMEKYELEKSSLITLLVAVAHQPVLKWRSAAALILLLTTTRTPWRCIQRTTLIHCTIASPCMRFDQR